MELLPVKREKAIPQIDDFRITKVVPFLCIFSQMPLVHDFWPATLNSWNPQNGTLQNTQIFEITTDNYTWLSYFQFKNESKNVAKTRFRPLSSAISSTWPSFCVQALHFSRIWARFWVVGMGVCDLVGLSLRTSLIGRPVRLSVVFRSNCLTLNKSATKLDDNR